MNKQTTFFVVAALAGLALVGVFVLMIVRPEVWEDAAAWVIQFVLMLAGVGGLAVGQAQQSKTIDTIKANTNGTLTALRDENAALRAALAERAPEVLAALDSGAVTVVRKE